MLAIAFRADECVRVLVAAGADLNVRDHEGKTVYM